MKKDIKDNDLGLYVKITEEESSMVKRMKSSYCINMSQFIRNAIREFYNKLESGNEKKE